MARESVTTNYEFHNFRNQFYSVISANLITFSHGCIFGWIAPALTLLASDQTPLESGPITLEELSWIGSINCIGAILGTFTFGGFTNYMGCKRAMVFLGVPSTLYWITIYFGRTVHWILFARLLGGWCGGGIFSISVLYVTEIADDRIRGTLGSIAQLSRTIGMLISYIVCTFLTYDQTPYVFGIIPIVYMINFALLPNTPTYWVKRGEFDRAENSLKYYKGCTGKSVAESAALCKELERMKALANERHADRKFHLHDFYERSAMKAIAIALTLSCLNQFCGSFIFMTYAGNILTTTGSNINPNTSSIIFGVVQIAGALITTQLADRWGRKTLLIVSLLGTVLGQSALSIYTILLECGYDLSLFNWIPVTSISFVVFIATAGIIPLTSICTVEALPAKIRTIGMLINTVSLSTIAFFLGKFFPIMSYRFGMYACLSIMSAVCLFGVVFIIFVVEETNGKNLDTIEKKNCADDTAAA